MKTKKGDVCCYNKANELKEHNANCETRPQHAPTPWDYAGRGSAIEVKNTKGEYDLVASLNEELDYQANAAFIVKCVNSHEELLALAREFEECCYANDALDKNAHPLWKSHLKRAKKAIAKAEAL